MAIISKAKRKESFHHLASTLSFRAYFLKLVQGKVSADTFRARKCGHGLNIHAKKCILATNIRAKKCVHAKERTP